MDNSTFTRAFGIVGNHTRRLRYLSGWLIPLLLLLLMPAASTPLQASIPNEKPEEQTSPDAGPDLVVTEIRLDPPNPQPGDTVDVNVVVQNVGDQVAPSGFRINIYVDPPQDPPTEDTRRTAGLFRGEALNPGDTFSLAGTNIDITRNDYVIYAWVDPIWENRVVETDDNNNWLRIPALVTPTITPTPTIDPTQTPDDPDPYEPDNDCVDATDLTVNGGTQSHNLTPADGLDSDVDWIKFDAQSGRTYTVIITPTGDDADLDAEYYDFCSGQSGLGTGIIFTIESDQNSPYYLRISHYSTDYGPDTGYTIEIKRGSGSTTTPTPTSTPIPDRPPPADIYEADNDCVNASSIAVDGAAQEHNLTPGSGVTSDIDWVQFDAVRGQTYIVDIIPVGDDADLYAEYYDFCSGQSGLGAGIRFTIESDQNSPYYVSIQHDRATHGPDTRYRILVMKDDGATPIPTTPAPADTPTDTPANTLTSTPTDIPTNTLTSTPTPTDTPANMLTSTPTPVNTPMDVPAGTWTLFIYAMGDNNLDIYLSEMVKRLKGLRAQQAKGVQVVVMFDGNGIGDSYRYILSEEGIWTPLPLAAEQGMDEPRTFREFLEWGYDLYNESDYYALSILGHASGVLGMGPDDSSGSTADSYLTPDEIRDVLRDVEDTDGLRMNVIHFDGCSFGLFESASIAANSGQHLADYIIASPNTGWGLFAYDVYRGIAATSTTPQAYAEGVAQHYADEIDNRGNPYTISVFDMTYYEAAKEDIGDFGNALADYISVQDAEARQQAIRDIRSKVQIYDSGNYEIDEQQDIYVDLIGFADEMASFTATGTDDIRSTANQAVGSLDAFVTFTRAKSGQFFHGGQTRYHDLSEAEGISIVYPYSITTGSRTLTKYIEDDLYPNLTKDWGWVNFLKNGLPTLSPGETVELDITLMAPLTEGLYPPMATPSPTPFSDVGNLGSACCYIYLPIIDR